MTNKTEIDTQVQYIDMERRALWTRCGSFSKKQGKRPVQPPEIRKANDRARAARWRCKNDKLRRPETATVAMALLKAFVMQFSKTAAVTDEAQGLIAAMMAALLEEGYKYTEVMEVMKRLRKRLREEGAMAAARDAAAYDPAQ
jgi:hypothetical protein